MIRHYFRILFTTKEEKVQLFTYVANLPFRINKDDLIGRGLLQDLDPPFFKETEELTNYLEKYVSFSIDKIIIHIGGIDVYLKGNANNKDD